MATNHSAGEVTSGIRSFLSNPRLYNFIQSMVGANNAHRLWVRDYVRPVAGAAVIEFGCGTGSLLLHLPDVSYYGIDLSLEYIDAARRRFDHRGHFEVGDVSDIAAPTNAFEIAVAYGLIHHLDDSSAESLLHTAYNALRPGGRLVTCDPTLLEIQPRLARAVINADRGQNVRQPSAYQELARTTFEDVVASVRTDFLRISYSHCILTCTKQ